MERKHGDLTIIAKAAECSVAMISDITKGRRRPSPQLAKKLEAATGIARAAWIWPDEYENPMIRKVNATQEQ